MANGTNFQTAVGRASSQLPRQTANCRIPGRFRADTAETGNFYVRLAVGPEDTGKEDVIEYPQVYVVSSPTKES